MAMNSSDDAPHPTIANQNLNANNISGFVGALNNNNTSNNYVTSIFYGDPSKESDAIKAKIAAILESRYVLRAVYGAQIETGCLDGTRVQVLREIGSWMKDLKGPHIFWLAGMAGTGKTAIAWTVCSRASLDPGIKLAGNFFCSRSTGVSAQRDVRCIIPTLAQHLALQDVNFAAALAAELEANPGLLDQQVKVQVEKLLYKPLIAMKNSLVPIVFVIDALDECGSQLSNKGALDDADTHRVVSDMLEALVNFSASEIRLPVKFFVTSRPETHIRNTHVSDAAFSKVLRLHTVDKEQITGDIRLYISSRLLATPTLHALFTEADVEKLVELSDGLFIVAKTVLQHALGTGEEFAEAKFRSLLTASKDRLSDGVAAPLDQMYAVIVDDAAKVDQVKTGKPKPLLRVLAALLCARMTLSIAALAELLDLQIGHLRVSLTRLHAVINVPDGNNDASLRPIHASFGDYMFGRASRRIRISEPLGHEVLAHGCFHVMADRLKFNISRSQSSFEPNTGTRPNTISLSIEYACLQWIYHVSSLLESSLPHSSVRAILLSRFTSWIGKAPPDSHQSIFDNKIARIIRPRLLFWLEVMSLLGQVQRAAAMLMFAASTVQQPELAQFLRDANSFVASSQEAITRSAPHIYLSALPFAAKDSLVYEEFAPLCAGLVSVTVFGIAHHARRLVMTLTGHDGIVNSVTYSPDGRLLASASKDGTVRIWDMRTGEEIGTPLRSGDGTVQSVTFAPSIQSIVSGNENGVVCIWSLTAAHVSARRLVGHSAAVSSVAAAPRGSHIASTSLDMTVRLWNVETNQQLVIMSSNSVKVHALVFAANGRTLLTGSEDRTIQIWDIEKGRFTNQPPYRHKHAIHSLCFIPNGQIAAGCGRNIILCKPQSGRLATLLYEGSRPILSINMSLDGLSLVSACGKSVYLTTLPRLGVKTSTVVLDDFIKTTCPTTLSPNGLYRTSAADDHTIRIWNAGSELKGQPTAAHDANVTKRVSAPSMSDSRQLMGHRGYVQSIAVSRDGAFIVSGSSDWSVCIWDAQTGAAMLQPLIGHTNTVYSVGISSDGCLIASGSWDCTVRLWDAHTGKAVGEPLTGHTDWVHVVVFAPDAQWLASGSSDKTVHIWDVTTRRSTTVGPFRCNASVYAIAFSSNGRLVAAGDTRGYISMWRLDTSQLVHEGLRDSLDHVFSVCFSPNGACIVVGGQRNEFGLVEVRHVNTGKLVLTLAGHTESVKSVAYSFDGRFLGTGSDDGTARIWHAMTGAPLAVLTKNSNAVRSVAFMPYGSSIVSGSHDKTIHIWDLTGALTTQPVSNDHVTTALGFAPLHNGWLKSPSGELLLWVPMEYRQYLHTAEGWQGVCIRVGAEGWHRGTSWTSCWHAKTDVIPHPIPHSFLS